MTVDVEEKGRYLVSHQDWGSGIYEIFVEELSPSGDWIKIMESSVDSKGKKKASKWYKKADITFHERLRVMQTQDGDIMREIEERLE